MSRIALLEDHQRLASMIRQALAQVGIETDIFSTISEAASGLKMADYAVIIIDRGLPDGDGLIFLNKLRTSGVKTPCLILTARDALHDRIAGLENGADDYVTKPFAMAELVARVRTQLRRPTDLIPLTPNFAGVSVDPREHRLQSGDRSVVLAPAELQIMLALVKARGKVVAHTALEHAAWGLSEPVTPNALEVTVHRLRKKMKSLNDQTHIVNIRGIGFALQSKQ
ncbi:two-component system response regulator [Brenneria alni]|uniref:Two-component system response regulator n=1 Tax=Brenneria alni TaxID=71656 RepID=A0A421DP87_9GAMM|nr:response regulator transcription factor [Brenneria alni]RLM24474.1 two-component system response regulator [Brenneria alni]